MLKFEILCVYAYTIIIIISINAFRPKAVDKNEGAIAVIGNEAYDSGIHESDIADTKMDDM